MKSLCNPFALERVPCLLMSTAYLESEWITTASFSGMMGLSRSTWASKKRSVSTMACNSAVLFERVVAPTKLPARLWVSEALTTLPLRKPSKSSLLSVWPSVAVGWRRSFFRRQPLPSPPSPSWSGSRYPPWGHLLV